MFQKLSVVATTTVNDICLGVANLEVGVSKNEYSFCGTNATIESDVTLSKCGQCMNVQYCSKACQKTHWKVHKKVC